MICTSLNHGDFTGALFVDLHRTFDTVDHQILLSKLNWFNFSPPVIKYFSSYLLARAQVVKIGQAVSPLTVCDIGVL